MKELRFKWENKKNIRVNVTEKDIREGRPFHTDSCPVARALQRAVKDPKASVGGYFAWIPREHDSVTVVLPAKVGRFIKAFDKGEKVEPFRFTLDVEVKTWVVLEKK